MREDNVAIGLIQTSITADRDLNIRRAVLKSEEAIGKGAKIICLPELFSTLYFPQKEDEPSGLIAETIPGPTTMAFSNLAKEHHVIFIVPLFEQGSDGRCYNSAAVIDEDGSLLSTYRKVHIPHDPLFYEKSYFSPGSSFNVYNTSIARFAVLICYDQWFPEAARMAVLQGADLIFYPTAIGYIKGEENPAEGDWRRAWQTVQHGHAISNGVHIAAVNRVGVEGDLVFWGGSFVCDSFGCMIGQSPCDGEDVLVARVDLEKNKLVRDGWGFLKNRRPDTYSLICSGSSSSPAPRQLGYHMPAEWEKQEAIWLSWPYDRDSFPQLEQVEKAYCKIVREISASQRVCMLVLNKEILERARQLLEASCPDMSRVELQCASYADVWFRDYGPTFLVNRKCGSSAMVRWIFNAWGGKYSELMGDASIPGVLQGITGIPCFSPGAVLEGGSIEVNGQGTALTTEQCLLNSNRNPHLERTQIESLLKDYLGAEKVIWLKEGIAGDDTDGHIDDIARFVGPSTVLCAYEDDMDDENYEVLKDCYETLSSSTDQNGNRLRVIKLPMPGFVGMGNKRLPASYANFYIANEAVLVPIFGHKNDEIALGIIRDQFPGRRVVGVCCREMVHGLGAIHCISQQQPAV